MLSSMCCCVSTNRRVDLSITVMQIRLRLQLQRQKIKAQGLKPQSQLVQQLKKNPSCRMKNLQEILIKQITDCCSRTIICEYLIQHCRKIEQYKHFLNDKKNFILIEKNIKTIIYSKDIIKMPIIEQFTKQAKRRYSQMNEIKEQEIEDDLIKHYKKFKQPTTNMMNQYVLQLCIQENLSLQQINSAGHNFKYGQQIF